MREVPRYARDEFRNCWAKKQRSTPKQRVPRTISFESYLSDHVAGEFPKRFQMPRCRLQKKRLEKGGEKPRELPTSKRRLNTGLRPESLRRRRAQSTQSRA